MARQSVLMIILALIGALIFLFVVMPQVVQLFFRSFGAGDLNFKQEDTIPPQIPIISSPPEATDQEKVKLTGFGEAESRVAVVVNGEEMARVAIDDQGNFSYTLELTEGENLISLHGVDEADNESRTRDFVIVLDTEMPSLAFEDLDEGRQIVGRDNQNMNIRGETEPNSQLTLNERSVFVRSDGTFTAQFYLVEGDNTLKFMVVDQAGNRTEREVRVSFRY
jgi:hypothetical protein